MLGFFLIMVGASLVIFNSEKLEKVLLEDIPLVISMIDVQSILVAVVPRAKAEKTYEETQLQFKRTVQNACRKLGIKDGTNCIVRHTNTRTTHIKSPNYINDGKEPEPGITMETCDISRDVVGRDILLIDDLYTKTVNIDEDAIQALYDSGAKQVFFYSIGCTVRRPYS